MFRIIPDKFVLEPFESCVITLEGSSNESVDVLLICTHSYTYSVKLLHYNTAYETMLSTPDLLQCQSVSYVMLSLVKMHTRSVS